MAGIDENTLLLLNGETLIDTSFYKVPVTNTGVQISNIQSKFGNSSMYFDGNSYLSISMQLLKLDFNLNWTLEWWEYTPTNPGVTAAVFCMPNASNGFVTYSVYNNNEVRLFAGQNGKWNFIPVTVIGNFIQNIWTHRAICKNENIVYCFENGNLITTVATSGKLTQTQTIYIGYRATTTNTGFFSGYLDEIRVSNIARWTSNFIPPTEPYSNFNSFIKVDDTWQQVQEFYSKANNVWQPVTGVYTKTNNTW